MSLTMGSSTSGSSGLELERSSCRLPLSQYSMISDTGPSFLRSPAKTAPRTAATQGCRAPTRRPTSASWLEAGKGMGRTGIEGWDEQKGQRDRKCHRAEAGGQPPEQPRPIRRDLPGAEAEAADGAAETAREALDS